jgi:hypothetical protein
MNNEPITIESFLPIFNGFYGTNFECDCEDYYIDDDKTYDDYKWDYAEYHQRVAKAVTKAVAYELKPLGIETEFDNLYSPKYYNFSNDSINVTYTLQKDSFKKLVDYCKENLDEFEGYLKDHFKSYDGFMSFFNYDSETWFNEYLDINHNKIATIFGSALDFYLMNEEYTLDDLEEEVREELQQVDYELIEVVE